MNPIGLQSIGFIFHRKVKIDDFNRSSIAAPIGALRVINQVGKDWFLSLARSGWTLAPCTSRESTSLSCWLFSFLDMFATNSAFRSPYFAFLDTPDEKHWTNVELLTNGVWFIATICHKDKRHGSFLRRIVLLTNSRDVERLAQQAPDIDPKFESVLIITPSWLNGTDTWQMDSLAAVWTKPAPAGYLKEVEIYETRSGLKYGQRHSNSINEHENPTLRYRFPVR